jgi:peptidoglycan/LPS O-acetylase OafA/YrhL
MTNQKNLSHPKYRLDIDGLRALAVLSVVAYHAFPYRMKGGFIGVDIFFVISGFLISTIIFENLDKGTFSFAEFYARRIKRIFPALIVVMLSCFAFGWSALLVDEYKQLGKHIAGGAGFISNIILWNEAGYFDGSAETKPLLHLWSLGIEEQYYIVYPFLMWLAWKRNFNLLTATIIIASVSFYLNIKGIKNDAAATFYLPQTRFWELLCGSLLAFLTIYKKSSLITIAREIDTWVGAAIYRQPPSETSGKISANVLSFGGLLLLAYGFWTINKSIGFPGKWAVLPTLGTALIIAAGTNAWVNRYFLSSKVLVWFGLISFPLYLWHWPILSFARIIESGLPSREIRIASVAASILLAWLTFKFIEKPIRYGNSNLYKTLILTIAMTCIGLVGFYSYMQEGLPFRKCAKQADLVNAEFSGTLWKYMQNEICSEKYPLKGSGDYGWWFCSASKKDDPTILLLGSSYANDLYPGFSTNPSFGKHSVLSIGTCDPAWVDESKFIESKQGLEYSPCVGYRHRDQQILINNIIENTKSLKYVVMNGLKIDPDLDYIERLKRRINFIESNGIRVIIFLPRVAVDFDEHGRMLVDFDIKGCFDRPYANPKFGCEIQIEKINKAINRFSPLIEELSKTNPSVLFFDQTPLFCQNDRCSFIRNGMPLIRDIYGHMSEYGSKELSVIFEEWARKNATDFIPN